MFSLHLPPSGSRRLPVAACFLFPSLFVFLDEREQSWFICRISRKQPWQFLSDHISSSNQVSSIEAEERGQHKPAASHTNQHAAADSSGWCDNTYLTHIYRIICTSVLISCCIFVLSLCVFSRKWLHNLKPRASEGNNPTDPSSY